MHFLLTVKLNRIILWLLKLNLLKILLGIFGTVKIQMSEIPHISILFLLVK